MIIVCDIDNVLNDFLLKTLALYNSRYGKDIKSSDITTYKFSDCLSKEDANGIVKLFTEKELWDSLEPLPHAKWGIETLINKGHKVIIATATHESNFEWKCNWMAKHFPMIHPKDIIRIHDKSLLRGDVLIDDCPEQLINSYCERICFDYLYNQHAFRDDVYDVYRVHDWKEIVQSVEDIERKMEEWKIM